MRQPLFLLVCLFGALLACGRPAFAVDTKARIAIVSSYHPEYLWSQDTNAGLTQALLDHGYLDNAAQIAEFTRTDSVESSRAVVLKLWMDTKRKNSRDDIKQAIAAVMQRLDHFAPDLILLGDDNAANHIGNQFIDTSTPVVFWGINGNPLKYDLIDSMERPGHNVTGVYQVGYMEEGLLMLQQLVGGLNRIAVLSDDSESGRSKAKEVERLVRSGKVPMTLVGMVTTNDYAEWQARSLALKDQVDAFFVLNHNTLKDAAGKPVDPLQAGAWYLRNIERPEVSHEKQFVQEGMLCAVDDSGFKQGYEAVRIAHRILAGGEEPGTISVYAPERGNFVVNIERARMLGLMDKIAGNALVEERLDTALALRSPTAAIAEHRP